MLDAMLTHLRQRKPGSETILIKQRSTGACGDSY